jgi:hypothetical protein
VEGLKNKPRQTLNIAQLFDLSRVCPEEIDGTEMETKIRDVMHKMLDKSHSQNQETRNMC